MATSDIIFDLSDLHPDFLGTIKIWASDPISEGSGQTAPPFVQTVKYLASPVTLSLKRRDAGDTWHYVAMFYPLTSGCNSTEGGVQVRFYIPPSVASTYLSILVRDYPAW